jgi:pimeloyl-ACP methyl ester carboxylesterase
MISQLYYAVSHRLPHVGAKLATSRRLTRLSTTMIMTTSDKELQAAIHDHHFDNLDHISSIGWYRRLYRQINRTGINRYRVALQRFDLLIINGNKDSVTPLKRQKKVAKLLGANLMIIPNVGHLSHYEMPERLATDIKNFLQ